MNNKNDIKNPEIKRGEMYYVDLCPVVGSEQGGVRPVLIIQNDINNKYSPTTIIAAMSKQKKKKCFTHVVVSGFGLTHTTLVLLEQIRTIDKSRLQNYIGTLDDISMKRVNQAIIKSFGLEATIYGKRENGNQ